MIERRRDGEGTQPSSDTAALLERARSGDKAALERLLGRYVSPLRFWAHSRLPLQARDLLDTDDLVQVSLAKALNVLDRFDARRPGGLLAYLRQTLHNEILQEIRRVGRRPRRNPLDDALPSPLPSPLEELVGRRSLEAYEAALASLPATQRDAVVLRLEFGFKHEEIANAIGNPSANATRMLVKRALLALAAAMESAEEHA